MATNALHLAGNGHTSADAEVSNGSTFELIGYVSNETSDEAYVSAVISPRLLDLHSALRTNGERSTRA